MSDAPYDLRDYVLDELGPAQRAEVERYLATSTEGREEVERLRLTRQALMSLPEEEMPQRIAFVSDKVFEPSRARRLWQGLWQGAPRLAFGMAAVLVVFFAGAWMTQPTIASDGDGWRLSFGQPVSVEQPVADSRPAEPAVAPQTVASEEPRELSPEQLEQIAAILRENQKEQREAVAELVRTATSRSNAELRVEFERIQQSYEDSFFILKAKYDDMSRALSEQGRIASIGVGR